jgi:4-hydroxy-tetrahydrodipicolinate synthase
MVGIQNAMESGDLQKALSLHNRFFPLFRDLFVESNPVPVKAAMSMIGWCDPGVRAPLSPLSAASLETLKASMKRCGITEGSRA